MSEPDYCDVERLRRLEEHLGFAEHTIDQLSQALREAIDAQRAMERRIALLERRLAAAESAAASEDESKPPAPDRSRGQE